MAHQSGGVASPCVGVCVMDSVTGFCSGCLRTIDEIMTWRDADDARRLAVLSRIRARRDAGHTTVNPRLTGTMVNPG